MNHRRLNHDTSTNAFAVDPDARAPLTALLSDWFTTRDRLYELRQKTDHTYREADQLWADLNELVDIADDVVAILVPDHTARTRVLSTGRPTAPTSPLPSLISPAHVDEWAGVRLSDAQFAALAAAIPHSSIPQAIETIVHDALEVDDDSDACRDPFGDGCRQSVADGEGWAGCCGTCADRMEQIHDASDYWGDQCSPSADGTRCTTCHPTRHHHP
jgi:hypothetical protein